MQLTAHKIARSLLSDLDQRQQAVSLLAELIGTANLTYPDTIRSVFNSLHARQPEYAWIGLADARGKVMVAIGGQLEQQKCGGTPLVSGRLARYLLG